MHPLKTFIDWIRRRRDDATAAQSPTAPGQLPHADGAEPGQRLDVHVAITDHMAWCRAFSEHLATHSVLPGQTEAPAQISDCRLGHWIRHASTHHSVKRHPAMDALQTEHQRFHSIAAQALALAKANRMDQASTLLNTDFERSRARILELLRVIDRAGE